MCHFRPVCFESEKTETKDNYREDIKINLKEIDGSYGF